ncbi:MAG: YqaA family protein [Pseudomonadota bacterium]|uniref:Membrane protein n=1 Tax=Vreelandella aquamarina TaxID=77097 RepID=A0A0D7UXT7_9GAMM|nr:MULTISPECIES: YqaA family protein [Halomonas]MCP1302270.1 DedA family protein [Halomonas sp. R1t8]MCP1330241.1 DedA family protein [Halomonas sp. R1t4]MEC8935946.1 YqaA family protein [Pseudomonadota bacterium]KJD18818.1 membrane protein [Halomonas meridiana]MCC4287053.1 DedA family protein [Halomonas meridiana]
MFSLFWVALASATLLPGGSEVWLARLWCVGEPALVLWVVATAGNTLGSLINVALGRYARQFQHRRWFPASPEGLARAERWYHRFGEASLLLSWLPVIGDPLTVLAGVMRLAWWRALLWIVLAKGARYGLLIALAHQWLAPYCQ